MPDLGERDTLDKLDDVSLAAEADTEHLEFEAASSLWKNKAKFVGLWAVLGDYEASIAEGSHNFNFPAVDFNDDSELMLVIDIGVQEALNLGLQIDSITSTTYFTDGRRIDGGVETLLDINSATTIQLASSTLLSANNRQAFIIVHIGLGKAGSGDRPRILSHATGGLNFMDELISGSNTSSQVSLTDITILTSIGNWHIGTRMTLYKLARA